MARPLLLPPNFHEHTFSVLMKKEPNPRNRFRLLAMYHLQQGKDLKQVAEIVQHHWQTVQSWLRRFREAGFDGLFESPRSGAPKKIGHDAEQWLHHNIMTLCGSKTGGYITGKALQKLLLERYDVKCSLKTVYNTLHRLKFSWVTSRSMHPKSDSEVQNAYKKNSRHA